MTDLVDFLRARLWEGEEFARIAHLAARHRERMLREVEAKRRILDLHQRGAFPDCRECGNDYPCVTVRLLALMYADHPDYDEEWRP